MDLLELLNRPVYSLPKEEKSKVLDTFLSTLTRHHYYHCEPYKKMLDSEGFDPSRSHAYTELPFLPVRLFKMFDLLSVGKEDIVKTMTSSGTSGQSVSRIFLDRETAANQTRALTKIVASFIGKQRLPMLIIDSESVIKNNIFFSARTAGVLGYSIFGNKRVFALDDNMELDIPLVTAFLEAHKNERIFIFGFTFMIWQSFYKALLKKEVDLDLSNAVLIHGGGWKKLQSEAVSPAEFKRKLNEVSGLNEIHDYYGMVEQTGSIYMECEQGHLHTPDFADVIIRRPADFSVAEKGENGIVQVVSILPGSYPGHSLLTEDEGVLLGEDECACGRLGKYFRINGRLKNAELRGCSDVYAERF